VVVYNRERVSEEFRQLGDLAEAVFRANLRNLSASPDAIAAHDELLARSCVFGYLYDRHFLATPELLLNELRWLRSNRRPEAPRHSIHPQRFAEHRTGLLDLLIGRFQNQVNYRESLIGGEPRLAAGGALVSPVASKNVRQSSDPVSEGD
jgi:hypothetical protein